MAATQASPNDRPSSQDKVAVNQMEHVFTTDDPALMKQPVIEKVDEFGAHTKTDPKEIALVKKIDWYILPMLWSMYFLNFLDRNAMINGKLDGLAKDLNLKGTQYNTCVSILFVGYLCGQVPSNMILNRVRPSWYMAGFMLAWSIVSLLTYKCHDYGTMLACRFLLGITEAPFYPGALYMLSMFYTRKEISVRMAIFYTGNMAASAFSGLIAAPIFAGMGGLRGLSGWQWLFIIQGAVSILVAFVAFFLLPDSPLKTRWLTEEERQLAHTRIYNDTTDRREGTSVWKGLGEAACDWRTWVFCLMDNLHLSANGFKNFLPSVVETLNYNTTITLVLTCPPYVFSAFFSVLVPWSSGRFNERTWHITISKLVVCLGFVMAVSSLNMGVRYTGIMIFVGATYGVNNLILGWTSSVLGQTDEKKAVAIAMANTLGNAASIYTPYLWPDADQPRYLKAMLASIGFSLGVIVCAWFMRFALMRTNRKKREADPSATNFYVY
ncbi:MFS transporter [Colletotrichum higginsianum IMI 349063]|uniref:MFS transporter n=4 Tax=Colletotrichum higginsianum TaxID=80884 RepID=A0A1B7YWP7_COLHI|nr:MFS transporter [Colletotrichum higginsianum IMI 349063]OBR16298.1 MFS transporter [Colletotrichum higginsianum IMI 349063]TID04709.1 putative transporter [Colletotrichum higginsianum]GJC91457.1 MFS transporter [Colletotrichum higginsianum]